MTPVNKLGSTESSVLAREEERISKKKAIVLFDDPELEKIPVGTFANLSYIHRTLFEDIYEYAGQIRTVNLTKGNFRFASALYLREAIAGVEKMPQSTYDQIIEKYVEMNIVHLFREGNGRSTRIWR